MLKVQSEKTIQKSNLDPKKPTKFIIHGFIDTPLSNWVKVIIIIKQIQTNLLYKIVFNCTRKSITNRRISEDEAIFLFVFYCFVQIIYNFHLREMHTQTT